MARPTAVAIAGCGVAGLATAALLRQQGMEVVLYDKLATPQPIGSGLILQPVGLYVLDRLGLGDGLRLLGARIDRLYGMAAPARRVVLDVRYDALGEASQHGVAVHRGALFQTLFDAASLAGVEFEPNNHVVSAADGRLKFSDGRISAKFDLVIDALGSRSPLSQAPKTPLPFGALWANLNWAGDFDPHALEQRYEKARKMVGVLPIGRLSAGAQNQAALFWSLKHEHHAAWAAGDLEKWKAQVLALWPQTEPLLAQIRDHRDLVFASYAHRTLREPISRHAAHVGDSWHCASPQLGQGANMALLDALALATAFSRQSNLEAACGEYARLRLWHIRLYQAASYLFTPAYQSDSAAIAWLRDMIVAPLSRFPPAPQILAALVAGAWGSPLQAMIKAPDRRRRLHKTGRLAAS
jgi:2-polyprenyl-6-methoxyphenol hydroxylase-like FAD-dependent oxidoreductase